MLCEEVVENGCGEDANSLNSYLGHVVKAECFWIEATELVSTQHLHLGRLAKTLDRCTLPSCAPRLVIPSGWEDSFFIFSLRAIDA